MPPSLLIAAQWVGVTAPAVSGQHLECNLASPWMPISDFESDGFSSEGLGGGGGRHQQQPATHGVQDEKRKLHNALERKRRGNIKENFDTLFEVVPCNDQEKSSRAQILQSTVRHIIKMNTVLKEGEKFKQHCSRHIALLEEEIERLENLRRSGMEHPQVDASIISLINEIQNSTVPDYDNVAVDDALFDELIGDDPSSQETQPSQTTAAQPGQHNHSQMMSLTSPPLGSSHKRKLTDIKRKQRLGGGNYPSLEPKTQKLNYSPTPSGSDASNSKSISPVTVHTPLKMSYSGGSPHPHPSQATAMTSANSHLESPTTAYRSNPPATISTKFSHPLKECNTNCTNDTIIPSQTICDGAGVVVVPDPSEDNSTSSNSISNATMVAIPSMVPIATAAPFHPTSYSAMPSLSPARVSTKTAAGAARGAPSNNVVSLRMSGDDSRHSLTKL